MKNTFFKYTLFIGLNVFLFFNLTNLEAQQKNFTIVLDAGHGGKDPGNLGTKRYKKHEKDIALDITLRVGKMLSDKTTGITVLYTRTKDVYPDLWKRAKVANESDADLFVSIHCNSFGNSAHGTETFVLGVHRNKTNLEVAKRENSVILLEKDHEKHYQYDPNSPESIIGLTLMQEEYLDKSIELAQLVEKAFKNDANRLSRGVKQAGLIVLHQTYMPSVLVEVGFLSNKKEEDFLNSKAGQIKIAKAIVKALKKYKLHLVQNEVIIEEDTPSQIIKAPTKEKSKTKKNIKAIFKVQIASGANKIAPKSYNFKGLRNVERVKVGAYYKYYLGATQSYSKIKSLRYKAQKKGYKSAFIVAFKNGRKVSVQKALKSN
ncbi:MAG: N-acetylmuramoyl-L-alanine amidase [Flavobacteriaceae bacterium]|nr:N-acetylmuramoyl-L-alanine amidase [Flavobacteriaceae bacterium]